MRIGIDCDLTTIASDIAWWNWLCKNFKGEYRNYTYEEFRETVLSKDAIIDYNLSTYFKEPTGAISDPFSFWRGDSTYKYIDAVNGSVEALKAMSKNHEIVFISAVKGNHHKSKYLWLERHFDFPFSFIATKEKWLVNVEMVLDDRLDILNKFDDNVYKVWYSNPYSQTGSLDEEIFSVREWKDVLYLTSKVNTGERYEF